MSKGGEKGRRMIGYPSHPRAARSTNIKVGGIYSYKLSAGALYKGARERAEGDLSPLKGLRFCRTPLPRSFPLFLSLSLSPPSRQRPTCTSRACFSLHPVPFSARSLMPHRAQHSVSLARPPDWKDESFASNKLPREPTSS